MVKAVYIVLDVEFNGRKFASDLPQEILEIGALKVTPQLEILGQFDSVVKPIYFAKLNRFVKQKTGITQEEIDHAEGFKVVFEQFRQQMLNEEFVFVTWGGEDVKVMLQDLKLHQLDIEWAHNPLYIDLLACFKTVFELKNDMNLRDAVAHIGLEWEGSEHRALSDAIHTTHIFKHLFHRINLEPKVFKEHALNKKIRNWLKNRERKLKLSSIEELETFYATEEFQNFMLVYKIDDRKLLKVKEHIELLRAAKEELEVNAEG
ncbi:exonuclease [compost metagenome]